MERIAAAGRDAYAAAARASVGRHGWRTTAERYVALLQRIAADRAKVDAA
jgi:hypothetical protein